MVTNDPWSPIPAGGQADKVLGNNEAWGGPSEAAILASNNNDPSIDPFSPVAQKELNEFDLLRNEIEAGGNKNNGGTSPNPFDLAEMGSTLNSGPSPAMGHSTGAKPKKSVHSLLGEHSNLVNLDNLVTDSKNNGKDFFIRGGAGGASEASGAPSYSALVRCNWGKIVKMGASEASH